MFLINSKIFLILDGKWLKNYNKNSKPIAVINSFNCGQLIFYCWLNWFTKKFKKSLSGIRLMRFRRLLMLFHKLASLYKMQKIEGLFQRHWRRFYFFHHHLLCLRFLLASAKITVTSLSAVDLIFCAISAPCALNSLLLSLFQFAFFINCFTICGGKSALLILA